MLLVLRHFEGGTWGRGDTPVRGQILTVPGPPLLQHQVPSTLIPGRETVYKIDNQQGPIV